MRILALIFSFGLHGLVLAVALSAGSFSRPRVDLDTPVYNVRLVSVAPPGEPGPGPAKEKSAPKGPEPAEPEPEPEPEAKAPEPEKPEAKPVQAPKQPKQPPKETAETKPEPDKPKPAPAKKPPAEPEPKKISPEKKKSQVAKPKKRKPEKPPEPSPEEVMAQALRSAKGKAVEQEKARQKMVAQELHQLRQEVDRESAGGGGGGGGSGGPSGTVQVYASIVENIIKKNWRYPAIGQSEELFATVEIKIDASGGITDRRLVWGSGKPEFDASVLKAVAQTEKLPPPPTEDIAKITINFNLQELSP